MGADKNVVVETDDWKLACYMDWKPKHHSEDCPYCNGRGEVGGHFKDLDGPRVCPECSGARIILKGPRTPKPPLPEDLVEHMRRAWWDFIHTESTSV